MRTLKCDVTDSVSEWVTNGCKSLSCYSQLKIWEGRTVANGKTWSIFLQVCNYWRARYSSWHHSHWLEMFDPVCDPLKTNYGLTWFDWNYLENCLFLWHWNWNISENINHFLILRSPGSVSSLAKSANGSIKSETENSGTEGDGDNINVVIRVRPISQKEQKANDEGIIQFPGEGQIWVNVDFLSASFLFDDFVQVDEAKGSLKPFTFNVVFEPEATQEDILEHSGMKR